MKQRTINVVLLIVIVVLIGAVAFFINKKETGEIQSGTKPTATTNRTFENNFIKVTLPEDWIATEATRTKAVNITKGNYILYINPQMQQASGVEGGRFAEIAMGAPSADAVVTVQPSSECGTSEAATVNQNYSRKDWFVGPQDKQEWCQVPGTKTVWYFSYISTQKGGYINYYKDGSPTGLVVTMSYNSKVVNNLPEKGSPELTQALAEMTEIVKSMEVKQQ